MVATSLRSHGFRRKSSSRRPPRTKTVPNAVDTREVASLLAAQRRFSEPSWSERGAARWLESRPEDGGRNVLVEHLPPAGIRVLSPPGVSVRSRLHAYGGGSYCPDGQGGLFVVEEQNQTVLHLPPEGGFRVHRPPREGALGGLVWDRGRRRLLLVHETVDGDRLLALHPGNGRWEPLHEEAGFLMQPVFDAPGKRLAWISWDAGTMPWERTCLVIAGLDADGHPDKRQILSFGGNTAFLEPRFGPGGQLFVLADGGGRWRIERVEAGRTVPFVETPGEIGRPAWNAAVRHYGFTEEGALMFVEIRAGAARLFCRGHDGTVRPLPLPFTEVSDLAVGRGAALVLAGALARPPCVARVDPEGAPPLVLASSLPDGLPPEAALPEPQNWKLPERRGLALQGWLYPPPSGRRAPPPLILRCHGGPTSAASPVFDPRLLLWRSLGAAILDLNYRGSSGFGRGVRLALAGAWGRADPLDVLRARLNLVREGRVDPARVVLAGSSAGGYTVLRALERAPAAGAVLFYPVSDLLSLEDEGVRFEQPYAAHLLDRNPARRHRLAAQRSPRPRGGLLRTPLLVFQGDRDPVVPPETTETFVRRLRARGAEVALHILTGEGHGFRRGDNLVAICQYEATFLASVFGPPP